MLSGTFAVSDWNSHDSFLSRSRISHAVKENNHMLIESSAPSLIVPLAMFGNVFQSALTLYREGKQDFNGGSAFQA